MGKALKAGQHSRSIPAQDSGGNTSSSLASPNFIRLAIMAIVGAAGLFFLWVSVSELQNLQSQMAAGPSLIEYNLDGVSGSIAALVQLEQDAMSKRHHFAQVSLMAHAWKNFVLITASFIMIIIGSYFVLGELKTESNRIEGSGADWKLTILSSSPGVVMAVLGTVLLIVAIISKSEARIQDASIYIGRGVVGAQPPASDDQPNEEGQESIGNELLSGSSDNLNGLFSRRGE